MSFELRGSRAGVSFGASTGWRFTLTNGRRTWTEVTQPSQLEMTVVRGSTVTVTDWQLGDKILLEFRVPAVAATWHILFQGSITDVSFDREVISIVAVDTLEGSLGRTWIDLPAADNVTMTAAATAVVNAAVAAGALPGAGSTIYSGLSQTNISYPAQTNQNALQLLNQLLQSEPNGVVGIRFGNAALPALRITGYDARRIPTMPSDLKFDCSAQSAAFLYEYNVSRRVADLINSATVEYNDDGTYTFSDAASVAAIGRYAVSVTTNLNVSTDAEYLARRLVVRNDTPYLRFEDVTVDFRKLTSATLFYNLARYSTTCGSWIKIPAMYTGAQTDFFVEGWRDEVAYSTAPGATTQWFRTMYITDINTTDAAQRWQEVTSGVTWATVNPAYTWLTLEETDI